MVDRRTAMAGAGGASAGILSLLLPSAAAAGSPLPPSGGGDPVDVTFTTAGATGAAGPSQGQADVAYAGTDLAGAVTVVAGVQRWTVPRTATYTVTIAGAEGGGGVTGFGVGGAGRSLTLTLDLTLGSTLSVVVGQRGVTSTSGWVGEIGTSGGGGAST